MNSSKIPASYYSIESDMGNGKEDNWHNGLCSGICGGDCGTCWSAFCCPCFLFAKTGSRMGAFPTDRTDSCTGDCFVFSLAGLVGMCCIPVWIKRTAFRKAHHLNGNGCVDGLAAVCCTPCTLAQMETEVKDRAENARKMYAGYSSPRGGMSYQPMR